MTGATRRTRRRRYLRTTFILILLPFRSRRFGGAQVVVFTGGLGDGAQTGIGSAATGTWRSVAYYAPVWRIDDGPVYGLSRAMCQRAMQSSLTAVSKGFPASFPSDLPCANISYSGPDKTYHLNVSIPAGTHTLWTGLMMETALQSSGWMQAWIEIADTIGPLFPAVPEV